MDRTIAIYERERYPTMNQADTYADVPYWMKAIATMDKTKERLAPPSWLR
ncbi:MAG: hypothetical protein ABI407_15385 [Bradyrhizobium sp.]